MNMKFSSVILTFVVFILITGCATQQVEQSTAMLPVESAPVIVQDSVSKKSITLLSEVSSKPFKPEEVNTVYFKFDSSELSDEALDVIQANAEYINNNPNLSVVVEGHTDARGSEEYNSQLGKIRAQAIQQAILAENISPERIKLVSYGEKRPAVAGYNNVAWRLNRRATIVYRDTREQFSSN